MNAIHVEQLSREFRAVGGTVHALSDFSLDVARGQIHGLLGPNGAGKTTLVKILSTVLLPTSGRVEVFGKDVVREPVAVRKRIAVVFGGESGLYNRLTGHENLRFWAKVYGLQPSRVRARIEELLERVGLADKSNALVTTYSRGMRQRLHLARGLLIDAELLLLDEPTSGMDPLGASQFRDIIRQVRAQGTSVLMATHDMEEAASLCDSVSMVRRGRVIRVASPAELTQSLASEAALSFEAPSEVIQEIINAAGAASIKQPTGGSTRYTVYTHDDTSREIIIGILLRHQIRRFTCEAPTLQTVYLRTYGDPA
jgi:ABC-2 type transport system ATP-binding protein